MRLESSVPPWNQGAPVAPAATESCTKVFSVGTFCGATGRQQGHDVVMQPFDDVADVADGADGAADWWQPDGAEESCDLQQLLRFAVPASQPAATAGTASAAAETATMKAETTRCVRRYAMLRERLVARLLREISNLATPPESQQLPFPAAGRTISLREQRTEGLWEGNFRPKTVPNRGILTMATPRLARDPNDRWIGGVCGGIARWLGWDPDMVRIAYILLSVLSVAFPGTIVYIILWILMPLEADPQEP